MKTRFEKKKKTFTQHFKMISGFITIRTPVVVLFLLPLGFVSPGVTGGQHVYSLAEHPQRAASSSLCPSHSSQTCQCSHALSDPAQGWGVCPLCMSEGKKTVWQQHQESFSCNIVWMRYLSSSSGSTALDGWWYQWRWYFSLGLYFRFYYFITLP